MSFYFLGERLVVDLLNTVIAPDGRVQDLLGTREELAAWARASGLAQPGELRSSSPRLRREPGTLRIFREQLRRGLLAWAASGRPSRTLVTRLNRELGRGQERMEIGVRQGRAVIRRRAQGSPLDRLYAAVARSGAELLASGAPRRLRKCANPSCRLMFYDVSKAGRRRWCSMQMCGARSKVRAWYLRRRRDPRARTGR